MDDGRLLQQNRELEAKAAESKVACEGVSRLKGNRELHEIRRSENICTGSQGASEGYKHQFESRRD